MTEIPKIKPGHEGDIFLDEIDIVKMNLHFRDLKLLSEQLSGMKIQEENIKIKQQLCEITKQNYNYQQQLISQNQIDLEKKMEDLRDTYEKTLRKDIKKKHKIPLDKNFSYDPNTYKVKIEG